MLADYNTCKLSPGQADFLMFISRMSESTRLVIHSAGIVVIKNCKPLIKEALVKSLFMDDVEKRILKAIQHHAETQLKYLTLA